MTMANDITIREARQQGIHILKRLTRRLLRGENAPVIIATAEVGSTGARAVVVRFGQGPGLEFVADHLRDYLAKTDTRAREGEDCSTPGVAGDDTAGIPVPQVKLVGSSLPAKEGEDGES